MKIILILLGLIFFGAAGYGVMKGSIYCKGRRYSRTEQPLGFWASVAVFVAFGGMLLYFAAVR